jgi:acyl transferase domain-containing protein
MKYVICWAGINNFLSNAILAMDFPRVIPIDRWDIERVYSPSLLSSSNTMYTRFSTILDHIDLFDANAFRTPRSEAVALDPQQRLLMEEAGDALFDASVSMGKSISNRTGM